MFGLARPVLITHRRPDSCPARVGLSRHQKNPSDPIQTTTPIPFNATPIDVQNALMALANIGKNSGGLSNVMVTQPSPGLPYHVVFQNDLANTNLTGLTINGSQLASGTPCESCRQVRPAGDAPHHRADELGRR